MARFTQLKTGGSRVRVDLTKVSHFSELLSSNKTELTFDSGETLVVDESYQTVSNRAAKGQEVDAEPVAAPVTGL